MLRSAFPAEPTVELDDSLHRFEHDAVVIAADGLEHANEVAGARDFGAEAVADRFVGCMSAQVVVAAGACGLEDDVHVADVRGQAEDRLAARVEVGDVQVSAVAAARADLLPTIT
jgi:hypothetical protein